MQHFLLAAARAAGANYLTWNDKRELSEAAKVLRIWLINEAARDLDR